MGATTKGLFVLLLLLAVNALHISRVSGLELKNGAYEELVVTVSDSVPVTNCKAILTNLEVSDFFFCLSALQQTLAVRGP